MKANTRAGEIVKCLRCGVRCKVADQRNDEARLARCSDGPGLCGNCVITEWLRSDIFDALVAPVHIPPYAPADVRARMEADRGVNMREALKLPHVQRQIERCLRVGRADLRGIEIDWDEVLANWDLPVVKRKLL